MFQSVSFRFNLFQSELIVKSKHGEITALEDSKAAPQKFVCQPFAKNQKLAPQVPQTPHFVVICVTRSDLEDSDDQAW